MHWLKRMIGMTDKGPASAGDEDTPADHDRIGSDAIKGLVSDLDTWLAETYGDISAPYLRTFPKRIDHAFIQTDDPEKDIGDLLEFELEGMKAHVANKIGEITDAAIEMLPTEWREIYSRRNMMEEFRSIIRVRLDNKRKEIVDACFQLIQEIDYAAQGRAARQRRREREASADTETILLRQHYDFRDWQAAFLETRPIEVAGIAIKAMETPSPASLSIHFWNAVIDHLIQASFFEPDIVDGQRAAHMGMAGQLQNYVRARWKDYPDTIRAAEEAWEICMQLAEHQEQRDALLQAGLVNECGQMTGNFRD